MVDYPYTYKVSSLEDFLKEMPNRPEPTTKVTIDYLRKLGYTSSRDNAILKILKFIGFLDSSGNITDSFRAFRNTDKSKIIMAQSLRQAYDDLFNAIANPHQKNLENYFRTATGRAGSALTATESTFKKLCGFADFKSGVAMPAKGQKAILTPTPFSKPIVSLPITKEGAININIDIKFELPITKDADVYDKIFQSLKKNILTRESKED